MAYNPRPPMVPGVPVPTMVGAPFTLTSNLVPTSVRLPMTISQPLPPMPPSHMRLNPPLPSQPPMPAHSSSPHLNKIPPYSQRVESSGPAVTVFVGNITEKAPDVMIRHLLNACGSVLSWKRVQGASGKLQAFGFCEFASPASALRAIRLLHNYEIATKKLVVKADSKTNEILKEYKDKRKKSLQSAANGNKSDSASAPGTSSPLQDEKHDDDDECLDEETKQEDVKIVQRIDQVLMEHRKDILNYIAPPNKQEARDKRLTKVQEKLGNSDSAGIPSTLNLDDMEDVEEGKKELISREITQFRELMKKQEEEKERDRRTRDKDRDRDRELRDRERDRERERERYEREEKRRRRSKSRSSSIRRSRSPERSRKDRKSSRTRSRSPHRSEKDVWRLREMEAEEKEEKEQQRKLKKKEHQYEERLKNWETRESKKRKELHKEKEREKDKEAQREKEANALRQFLEDYDDDRDDPKYYKGHLMERKIMDREAEKEADARDRAKEKEELQELRNRINSEGHNDPEAIFERVRQEREALYNPKPILLPVPQHEVQEIKPRTPEEPPMETTPPVPPHEPSPERQAVSESSDDDRRDVEMMPSEEDNTEPPPPVVEPENSPKIPKKKKLDVKDVFNQDDDEESGLKRRKLSLPSKEKEKSKEKGGEEKRKHIKSLIDQIPTTKDELFAFPIDSKLVDDTLMEKRIRPWVNKKIVEYIGEPEPTLVDFICSKLVVGSDPKALLHDVQMVLDDEAEVFVVKMWRLLIYELESKKAGFTKS